MIYCNPPNSITCMAALDFSFLAGLNGMKDLWCSSTVLAEATAP